MKQATKTFQHVNDLWDFAQENKFQGNELELLIYRSNLLGRDLRITNYGGGNTSCKTTETDKISGEQVEIMWIKGSGGNLGTLNKQGLAGLYLSKLHTLKKQYKGLKFEDEMVRLFDYCIFC